MNDRYRKLGIDPLNPNPDGSDYHLMNIIDEQESDMPIESNKPNFYIGPTKEAFDTASKEAFDTALERELKRNVGIVKSPTNGASPGDNVREMAEEVARQARGIAEGTDQRVAEIGETAKRTIDQLNNALQAFKTNNRQGADKLAEAVRDQFGVLAQQVDDLFAHCNNATTAFEQHRENIVKGVAAIAGRRP